MILSVLTPDDRVSFSCSLGSVFMPSVQALHICGQLLPIHFLFWCSYEWYDFLCMYKKYCICCLTTLRDIIQSFPCKSAKICTWPNKKASASKTSICIYHRIVSAKTLTVIFSMRHSFKKKYGLNWDTRKYGMNWDTNVVHLNCDGRMPPKCIVLWKEQATLFKSTELIKLLHIHISTMKSWKCRKHSPHSSSNWNWILFLFTQSIKNHCLYI